jgi:transglutaminase-like putative cysteine protease
MRRLARKRPLALLLSLVLLAVPVVAGPVLHERFLPDPAEDLRLGATNQSGTMPATLQTRSGLVSAPDEVKPWVDPVGQAYGGGRTPTSADASYHIDRLTTRPERVKYDEPFRPSILPFKRLYAFDLVKEDLSLGVAQQDLVQVNVGGLVAQTEDAFFADFEVDLVGDVPVRIPSVGPGARIRALHVDPPQEVAVLADSAENWFAKARHGGRARMVMQLSIERQTFGSPFRPVPWQALFPHVPSVPVSIRDVAAEVAAHAKVDRTDSPAAVLATLVDYFRRFRESSDLPTATNPADLYRELSFEQKGVCRHRAYAFAITALALGLPTRVVHNEAHAWVEVFDSEIWHRIDLGGAASDIRESQPDPLALDHRPPSDPHTWPQGATSAAQERALAPRTDASTGDPLSPGTTPSETDAKVSPGSWPSALHSTAPGAAVGPDSGGDNLPQVALFLGETKLIRGRPLPVSGRAHRGRSPCRLSRVDILVQSEEGLRAIGSVATDREGAFQGSVTLPPNTPVGRLELSAQVGGGCD